MAAQFPDTAYSTNTQDTVNDGPANDELGQAADYNKHDEEIDALTQEGRKSYLKSFRNDTGSTLTKGTLVFISGFNVANSLPTVTKAKADDPNTRAEYLVVADVANNANGNLAQQYTISGIDTSSFSSVGDHVYLDITTAGIFTQTAPNRNEDSGDNGDNTIRQHLGRVLIINVTTGSIHFNVNPDDLLDDNRLSNITKDNEGDTIPDAISFTFTVQDRHGVTIQKRTLVRCWMSSIRFGGAVDSAGNLVTLQGSHADTADFRATEIVTGTNGTGQIRVTQTGAVTRFFMAATSHQARSLSATWV